MENFYLVIVGILLVLAISDLVVGVSNDAVNFLNSAIGSKVAPLRVILIIATLGILVGATFSSGMMEVARKGIFNPGEFYFSDLMIIFLAVMLTDILLLDLFNTFGLPTSTTVSIVFELLGAAVGIAVIKLSNSPDGAETLGTYINSSKALAIISGILLSVVVAFTVGAIIMYLTRILFTFNYKKNLKYFGSVWGGIAITAITYFMLIKGAKGASFMGTETVDWISENTTKILLYSFLGWTVILQLLSMLFRINIPKIIVLVGTFSLAMAFAGNDLVNFIGVPLAGLESFKGWMASGEAPDALLMTSLAAKVKTPTIFLLAAGIIMALALWTSKKSRTVTKTELNLSKHDQGSEMFSSSGLARALVRMSIQTSGFFNWLVPRKAIAWLDSRFDTGKSDHLNHEDDMMFDLLRASINLVVAGVLIAYGTSQKLPLSTTYVTFMVAMGTSLADRAWGRETAVYRITGVMIVITGWFFTAMAAFISAFLIAIFINWAGMWAIIGLAFFVIYMLIRSFRLHRKRTAASEEKKKSSDFSEAETEEKIIPACRSTIISNLLSTAAYYNKLANAISKEDLKSLRKLRKEIKQFNISIKLKKDNVHKVIKKLDDKKIDAAPYYVQIFDYLREAAHALNFIVDPAYHHIDNNHTPLSKQQLADLKEFNLQLGEYFNFLVYILKSDNFDNIRESAHKQSALLDSNEEMRKAQIKRIKKGVSGTRASMLFLNILNESKGLVLHAGNSVKAYRDFNIAFNRP
ncbi:MAG: inorganic phosphate transporter [Marinilabiliaceae bacterium]|jgi:phosphate/sulfate permease|nr:inorganic phosphate transporter [Marinilabiliaceae bacterium]